MTPADRPTAVSETEAPEREDLGGDYLAPDGGVR